MKVGDGMMIKNARILVVAAASFVLLGSGIADAATSAVPVLEGLATESGPDGPVIRLRTSGDLDTVHYSPQPGVWIVEMPEATWADGSGVVTDPAIGLERAELAHVEEFGKRVTRLTVWLAEPAQLDVERAAGGLELRFQPLQSPVRAVPPAVESEGMDVASAEAPAEPAPDVVPHSERPALPPVVIAAADQQSPAAGRISTDASGDNLLEVVPVAVGEGVRVELRADGELAGQAFTLPKPDRIVIDLPGVVNRVPQSVFSVASPLVRRVRVAQFRSAPDPVTRVVVDLTGKAAHQLIETPNGAVLTIGDATSASPDAVAQASTDSVPAARPSSGTIEMHRSAPAEPDPAPAQEAAAAQPTEASGLPAALFDVPERQAVAADSPAPQRNPFVADPSQLIESAVPARVLDLPTNTAETYSSTEVATQEQQFTGEPITLTLKDADIADVLKTFSALTNLNIVLDPGVRGAVTVELHDVPWDQALDLILKINNLDYVLENNVLRVASTSKLAKEKADAVNFLKQQEAARPLKTVIKPVSYAKAQEIRQILTQDSTLMSERGTVNIDARTNSLIIRDTVDRVEGVLRLVDYLDQPTPQVVIEGRIVETTRDFSYSLGVNWGFTGVKDAAHGNDTGLDFPNSMTADGRVGLGTAGNGTLSLTFGDILNTFNLDFLLSAAESNGVVKIVSTPRVTTQNLQRASIRSGLQIPVQTVANNTVTVQYVDATLRLDVLPQITAEGTVMLDINIRKQEAQTGLAVEGGRNVPIFTRDAQTSLLVRDGGTTVIAGIYQINDQNKEGRVPGLWKIPILGHLFKNKDVFNRHDELLIFITPRIVKY
jgi:type IV pilus secretin PilQ/predicted competence protein